MAIILWVSHARCPREERRSLPPLCSWKSSFIQKRPCMDKKKSSTFLCLFPLDLINALKKIGRCQILGLRSSSIQKFRLSKVGFYHYPLEVHLWSLVDATVRDAEGSPASSLVHMQSTCEHLIHSFPFSYFTSAWGENFSLCLKDLAEGSYVSSAR